LSDTLRGIRIVDLTWMLAGPYATMLLADMGAEVIKVEGPEGDPIRKMGPPFESDGSSAYFRAVNRNKKSVMLDLRSASGRSAFLDLVRTADAVIDNFRAGVMGRLRLTHEDLSAVKPNIVTCSITAFGEDGPYRELPAFDLIIQAMGGGMSITGEPGAAPTRAGIPIGDLGGGLFAALAVCAGLLDQARTGRGQHIDLSLLDAQVSLLTYVAQYYLTDGQVPGPSGSAHRSSVPYQAFETADGHLVICVLVDHFWPKLCRVLGLTELGERYPTNADRVAARDAVVNELQERFRERKTDDWIRDLRIAGVPVGPVNTIDLVLSDPQVRHRAMVATDGQHRIIGNPMKTGGADSFRPAPTLGEHNVQLLGASQVR
jgi:crotonobetainyl-CoA:carnitine CoA-transferase CaiB-like acyl-CoA transferase